VAEPGWSDIAATDALLSETLHRAGYTAKIETLAVPIIFQALARGRLDVFLGNWMPAQQHFADTLLAAHRIDRIVANLAHARFTLAVPAYVAAAGVHDIADLGRFADRFDRRIYGIDPGSPGNESLRRMIETGNYGLKDWRLVESSEFGMRAQMQREVARHAWIVFLAWEPNPMNTQVSLVYLSGGQGFIGPDYGSSTVYTVTRHGLSQECPVLAQLLHNVSFDTNVETEMMEAMTERHEPGPDAARAALARHPELARRWLADIPALP
jgi:glycine betaine/proline transport system substrate-binding protein